MWGKYSYLWCSYKMKTCTHVVRRKACQLLSPSSRFDVSVWNSQKAKTAIETFRQAWISNLSLNKTLRSSYENKSNTVVMKSLLSLGRLINRSTLRSSNRLLTKPYVAENGAISASRRFLYALSSKAPINLSDFTSLKPSQFPSSHSSPWSHFGGQFF